MPDLSRKRERERLAIRREAYWQRLAEGAYLGFRRGPDTWLARVRLRTGKDERGDPVYKQQWQPLGDALDYDDAKRAAEEWIAAKTGSVVRAPKRANIRQALEAYVGDLRRHLRHDTAKEVEGRYKLTIWNDRLAEVEMESATRDDFLEWRDRLADGRTPRSVNRQVRAVMAGLNKAHEIGVLGRPDAWKLKPLPDDVEEEGDTAVYLSPSQRADILANCRPEAAAFFTGLQFTGARPKELAQAKVSDFDGATLRLFHRKGRAAKVRVRRTVLSKEAVEFFTRVARNRLNDASLFTEDGERPWRRHVWAREINDAIARHNASVKEEARLPGGITAYAFRHTRISELLQVHGVDPLTIAQQLGTSLAMLERAYFKLIPAALRAKLAAIEEG